MWLMTIFIDMSSPSTEHAVAEIGTPFFAMPITLAPLTLCGKFFIGPVPWAVNGFDHPQDMSRGIGGGVSGEPVDNLVIHLLVGICMS